MDRSNEYSRNPYGSYVKNRSARGGTPRIAARSQSPRVLVARALLLFTAVITARARARGASRCWSVRTVAPALPAQKQGCQTHFPRSERRIRAIYRELRLPEYCLAISISLRIIRGGITDALRHRNGKHCLSSVKLHRIPRRVRVILRALHGRKLNNVHVATRRDVMQLANLRATCSRSFAPNEKKRHACEKERRPVSCEGAQE